MISAPIACDVLVVGAGPAGSALAAALAGQGRDVLLIEAMHHPRAKACAEYASPRILDELRRLEVPDADWRADALPLAGMRVIRGADAVDVRYRDAFGRRTAWGLDRVRFDAMLAAHAVARGARLLERTAFDGILPDAGGPTSVVLRTPMAPWRCAAVGSSAPMEPGPGSPSGSA